MYKDNLIVFFITNEWLIVLVKNSIFKIKRSVSF